MAPALALGVPMTNANANANVRTTSVPAGCLPGARVQDLHHAASGRTWRVWMQRPVAPPPKEGYPVLWLLDGNASFSIAAQFARNQEARPAHMRGDALVVIAVGHPTDEPYAPAERQRDYTPPSADQPATSLAGGANDLLDFMLEDVRQALPAEHPPA
jgi:predicted alpha/beta superfamily hydrolase